MGKTQKYRPGIYKGDGSVIEDSVPKLVTTRPEAEIAADLKKRFEEAMGPALEIMDEAIKAGLAIQFDSIQMGAPLYRNKVMNLRVVKQY